MMVTIVMNRGSRKFLGVFGSPALARATLAVTFSECGGVEKIGEEKVLGYNAEVFRSRGGVNGVEEILIAEMQIIDIVDHL